MEFLLVFIFTIMLIIFLNKKAQKKRKNLTDEEKIKLSEIEDFKEDKTVVNSYTIGTYVD